MDTAAAPDPVPDPILPAGLVREAESARPILVVRPDGLAALRDGLAPEAGRFLAQSGFGARAGELALLPGPDGIEACLLGLGSASDPLLAGGLPDRLPPGAFRFDPGSLAACGHDLDAAVLGFALGAYRFRRARPPEAVLVAPDSARAGIAQARAIIRARDLINTPANRLGPSELAAAAAALARAHGAVAVRIEGESLARDFPAIEAVGRGSDRPPVVAGFDWRGTGAGDDAPLVALVGKGVCFDTGGYDLKPSAAMLRMKKDMGGAAVMLAVAELAMAADLPIRLALRIGCVENAVSGRAMRPSDVIATRDGRSVEVNNTDAEGRLVLADLLAEAAARAPDLLLDAATLTGAARVALGPDLPALFTDDEALADALLRAAREAGEPMWRLPLWDGYDEWLDSPNADLANISARAGAGAIIAALFLRRFVPAGIPWAHVDVYCWNDRARPGRPEGGEAQAVRALFLALSRRYGRAAAGA